MVRGIIKGGKILILDEPTSALDYISQKKIMEYLLELKKDKTILIITHCQDIVNIADQVISL